MRALLATLILALLTGSAFAVELVPPPHQARTSVDGVIRVWGSAEMKPLLERWEKGFRRQHPRVRIESHLTGSDIAMAGLYTGNADIALLGREATAPEVKAFEWIYRYRPTPVDIATGSLDRPGRSPALVAYVHRDNPLARISLRQLDAIFSRERLRGAPAAIATWGDLGLEGEWSRRPINLYTFDTETGTGRFFRSVALKDSRLLDWERITEFTDTRSLRDPSHDAGNRILEALSRDRYGLAVASGPATAATKALALAGESGEYHAPTRENLVTRRYPLARAVYAYVDRKPDTALDAPVAEFLRYVLGVEGQGHVAASGSYLGLEARRAREQARKLR